jgi:hypothetical protein
MTSALLIEPIEAVVCARPESAGAVPQDGPVILLLWGIVAAFGRFPGSWAPAVDCRLESRTQMRELLDFESQQYLRVGVEPVPGELRIR